MWKLKDLYRKRPLFSQEKNRLLDALLESRFAPLYFPLPFSRGSHKVKRLHWKVTQEKLSKVNSWRRKSLYLLITIAWPLLSMFQSAAALLKCRILAGGKSNRFLLWEFISCWLWSVLYLQQALGYFFYRFEDPRNRRRCNDYIRFHELVVLLPKINPPKIARVLRDKLLFERRCRDAGLPTPPVIAKVTKETIEWRSGKAAGFPRMDLFLKPVALTGGKGAECLYYIENNVFKTSSGQVLAGTALSSYVREMAARDPYLIQPRVFNHCDLSSLSDGGICTVRLVTFYEAAPDQPDLLLAVLGLPRCGSIIDNIGEGGAAAPISPSTGRLGQVVTKTLQFIGECHPDTGAQVTGLELPYWDEVVRLCLKAQSVFQECPTVGWDIAVTDEGPVLLEGNAVWGGDLLQIPHNHPLGQTPFLDFCLRRIDMR